MVGLIHLMLAMVHAMTSLCSLSIQSRSSSYSRVSLLEIMTGRVLDGPRKAYRRFSSRGLSSKLGGHSIDEGRVELNI